MVKPLRVLTWNAGHLGQQQWAELRTWLRTASDQYDVIALQETHWQESTEFDVEGWPSKQRQGQSPQGQKPTCARPHLYDTKRRTTTGPARS